MGQSPANSLAGAGLFHLRLGARIGVCRIAILQIRLPSWGVQLHIRHSFTAANIGQVGGALPSMPGQGMPAGRSGCGRVRHRALRPDDAVELGLHPMPRLCPSLSL
jgi:hypothetical protein